MRTAWRTKTVAYVSAGILALTAVVAGAAVALTHAGGAPGDATTLPGIATTSTPTPLVTASPRVTGSPGASPAVNASLKVPPLHNLTPPDAVITLRHAASGHGTAWLRKQAGVHHVAVADRGTIRIHGVKLRAWGVPLGVIRGFTPSLTASSNPLWESIARGELTVSYANGRNLRKHLGQTYVATGPGAKASAMRVGAFATIGLGGAQALLSQPAGQSLGLQPARVVLIAAPKLSLDTLTADIRHAYGTNAHIDVTRAAPVDQSIASQYALDRIPATYLDLYRRAAVTCPGLPWTVLAGIGTVETGNGANVHRSTAGALGPMQFIRSTWAMYGYDADGNGKADIRNPTDAVFSAARYLCAAGAGRGGQSLDNAIFAYNHAWWYVREVINIANSYA
jgi:hypothetical protein